MRRDPEIVSKAMRSVRGRDTSPERRFRSALWAAGLRFRTCVRDLPGRPDIANKRKHLAVFVDGDFWHGNQWYARGFSSVEEQFAGASNGDYWISKIRRNTHRDQRNVAQLVMEGWRVLRFWESELQRNLERCVTMTVEASNVGLLKGWLPGLPEKSFAEFFAGIGLVRLGLNAQGWEAAFANDIDPGKEAMYSRAFADDPAETYVLRDIHYLKGDDVPTISLASASFPCNDLSLAGARRGLAGAQSGTVFGFLRVLREMGSRRPPIVMLENVPGFLTSHRGADFARMLGELSALGYGVDAFMVDAIHFVPQSRLRMFVIGIRAEEDATMSHGLDQLCVSEARPEKLVRAMRTNKGVAWRIRRLPGFPERETWLADVLEDLPDNAEEWWDNDRVDYLTNQMSEKHLALAERMRRDERDHYGTVFRRTRKGRSMAELRIDGVAGCLRTPRGGSSRQILFRAGAGQYAARFLTPRECARLQGVPDTYPIEVPFNQALFGFGDAVCVPVIEWIASHYLEPAMNELMRGRVLALPEIMAVTGGGSA